MDTNDLNVSIPYEMNKEEFYNNLINAMNTVYPFTSEMVLNKLPNDFKHIVKIYSS